MNHTISSLDFCAIAGVSPYDSPLSLFLKKTGKVPKEREETFQMKLGKKMERLHRELLQERGIVVISGDFNLRKHPHYEAFISVPDGFCHYNDGVRVVENKTCLRGKPDEIFFETQLRWEMMVCQCNGLLTILTPDELIVREYDRSEQWEAEAIELANNFLQLLERSEPPSIDNYHPATYQALRLVERIKEEPIVFDSDVEEFFKKIDELTEALKANERMIELLKSHLLARLGEHKEARCNNYKLRVIDYMSKPSITITSVNDDVLKLLNQANVKYKLNEAKRVVRVDILKIEKEDGL